MYQTISFPTAAMGIPEIHAILSTPGMGIIQIHGEAMRVHDAGVLKIKAVLDDHCVNYDHYAENAISEIKSETVFVRHVDGNKIIARHSNEALQIAKKADEFLVFLDGINNDVVFSCSLTSNNNDMDQLIQRITSLIYRDRISYFVDGQFDVRAYELAAEKLEVVLSLTDYNQWQNSDWMMGSQALISLADRVGIIKLAASQPMYHATNHDYPGSEFDLLSKGDVGFICSDKDGVKGYGKNVIEVPFSPKTPLIVTDSSLTWDIDSNPQLLQTIRDAGYDSIIGLDMGDAVVLSKTALGNEDQLRSRRLDELRKQLNALRITIVPMIVPVPA